MNTPGESTRRRARLQNNAVLNAVGFAAPLVLALATTPFYLELIGIERYGALALIWVFLSFGQLSAFGIGRTLIHLTSGSRTRSYRNEVVWTAVTMNAALSVVAAISVVFVGRMLLGEVLHEGAVLAQEIPGAVYAAAGTLPVLAVAVTFVAALEAQERFVTVNVIEVLSGVATYVAPLVVASVYSVELAWLVVAAASGPLLRGVCAFAACVWRLEVSWPSLSSDAARALFRYGRWVVLSTFVGTVISVADRPLIALEAGAVAVGTYALSFNLVSRLTIAAYSVGRALFPRLSTLTKEEASALGHEALLSLAALLTPLVVGGMFLFRPFLEVWLDEATAAASGPAGEVLLFGVWINSLALIGFSVLQAQDRPSLPAKYHTLEAVPYLVVLWIAVRFGHIEGAALAWSARNVVDAGLLLRAAGLISRREHALLLLAGLVAIALGFVTFVAPGHPGMRVVGGILLLSVASGASWRIAPSRLRVLVTRLAVRISSRAA